MDLSQQMYDVLVIGSGAAGLSLAIRLANTAKVAIISKAPLEEGCTTYAQGGIAAVLSPEDSITEHANDTISTGSGLCDPDVVRFVVEQGKDLIHWLTDCGVEFTKNQQADGSMDLHLTRESGHSHRRIVHADDATGKAVETALIHQVKQHQNITILENHLCVDLITSTQVGERGIRCLGAYVIPPAQDKVSVMRAKIVVVATGGAGKVYLYTSNPDVSSGDGIAMCWRAGCRVANMEFIQFHPTCLYHPQAKSFLMTEAIRGEGGKLRLADGSQFMDQFDPRGELAPRDVVARAIDHEMKRLGRECVYLDISHKPAQFITSHFPNIYKRCLELGYDMTQQAIPVVPAAHYTCGGVMTDIHGRTDIQGLYAIGEMAHTGLHGANRIASNSLLECFVFAKSASLDIQQKIQSTESPPQLPEWDESRVTDSDEVVVVTHNWHELRRFMWDYVGIVRTTKRLERAKRRIDLLQHEIEEYYGNFRISSDLIELRNLVLVAGLIVRSAMERKESRGLHYILDYPTANETKPIRNTVLNPTQGSE